MTDRIAAHVYIEGKCVHCGITSDNADTKSCVWRDAPPRPKPTSIFYDLAEIGARLKEIQKEEDAALAGTTTWRQRLEAQGAVFTDVPEPADF